MGRSVRVGLSAAVIVVAAVLVAPGTAWATPKLVLKPTSGPPTTTVTATGTGYAGSQSVTVKFDSTVVDTTTSNASGKFTSTFAVPATAAPGSHTIVATESPSGAVARATFKVRTDWAQDGFSATRGSFNPFENTLKTGNVSGLALRWKGNVGQGSTAAAVVKGVVYVGAFTDPGTGSIYAFKTNCGSGGGSCTPLWRGDLGDRDVVSAPAVVGGKAFVAAQDGKVYAFNANGCGASVCSPLWVGSIGSTASGHSSPAVAHGR